MPKHFTGTHAHKMDVKGRVSLPTEFRRVLETVDSANSVHIVPQFEHDRCHVVFSEPGFDRMVARHNERAYDDPEEAELAEIALVSEAQHVQVDDMGRLVIAKPLRDTIGLDKEVVFVGRASNFEIWAPEAWATHKASLAEVRRTKRLHFDRRGLHD